MSEEYLYEEYFAEAFYSNMIDLCRHFGCYGRFHVIEGLFDTAGIYFIAGMDSQQVEEADPLEIIKKYREPINNNSTYLPLYAIKLDPNRASSDYTSVWEYVDEVEFIRTRFTERGIKIPEYIDNSVVKDLVHWEREQLNPRYSRGIKEQYKKFQEEEYEELRKMIHNPRSLKAKWFQFGCDPRGACGTSNFFIQFMHFLFLRNR